jgi:hypothetical protein
MASAEAADVTAAAIIESAGMKLASLTQYLGVVFVAMLLTVIELQTFRWTVIPGVRQGLYEQLREIGLSIREKYDILDAFSTEVDPLLSALNGREANVRETLNDSLMMIGQLGALLLVVACVFIVFRVMQESHKRNRFFDMRLLTTPFVYSALTVVGIIYFQGILCLRDDGTIEPRAWCYPGSFSVVTSEWKQNQDVAAIVLESGICDKYPGGQEKKAVDEARSEVRTESCEELTAGLDARFQNDKDAVAKICEYMRLNKLGPKKLKVAMEYYAALQGVDQD